MKTKSAKAKGRTLQNWVRDYLLQIAPFLSKSDVKSTTMGESGEDIQFSAEARRWLPFSIECKNREADAGLWKAYDQASATEYQPLLFIKKNGKKPIVVMDAEYFIGRFLWGDLMTRTEGVNTEDVKSNVN